MKYYNKINAIEVISNVTGINESIVKKVYEEILAIFAESQKEYIQKRYMFLLDVKEALYEKDDGEGYELGLRKLRAKMQQINLPYLYFCNAGVIVQEDIFKRGKLKSSEVYTFVDPAYAGCEGVMAVPASTF